MRWMPILVIAAASLVLAGCPKKPTTVPEAPAESAVPQQGGASGAGSDSQLGQGRDLPGAGAAASATSPPATAEPTAK